jgi:uncharacterized membrane protein YGL010W
LKTDFICGLTFSGFLLVLRVIVLQTFYYLGWNSSWSLACLSVAVFVVSNLIQTKIGHRFFEPLGRDDTNKNLSEFASSKNVVPLLLIFYYHWVELLFLIGYKPELKQEIMEYRDEYIKENFPPEMLAEFNKL